MQVWLDPVDYLPDFNSPYPGVLTRIDKACTEAGFNCQSVQDVLHDACMVLPGNLDMFKSELDVSQYAAEVVRTERVRLQFPKRLKEALLDIDVAAGDTIEWCLPFVDYDLHFIKHDKFIAGLQKFPNLMCYLIVADPSSPLMSNYRGCNFVRMITETTLEIMAPATGFPQRIQPLPPPPPPVILPPSWSFQDMAEEEEEAPPKPKKPKRQYRSIDDD